MPKKVNPDPVPAWDLDVSTYPGGRCGIRSVMVMLGVTRPAVERIDHILEPVFFTRSQRRGKPLRTRIYEVRKVLAYRAQREALEAAADTLRGK